MALLLCCVILGGCAWQGDVYPAIYVEAALELVFSHKHEELVLIRADGGDPWVWAESKSAIITPRFSPDGEKIAFYDVGSSSPPVSSTRVTLHIAWFENKRGREEPVELLFPLPQFDTDHRLTVDNAVAPIWEPHGRSLLIPHNAGIERITLFGERAAFVEGVVVTAIMLSHDGRGVIYSTGDNIYTVNRNGGAPERMLAPEFVPEFGNRFVRAMTLSPEGDRLAFAVGHEVFVMEIGSGEVEKIFEVANRVYWIAWAPDSEQIVLTYGKEDFRSAFYSPWMSDPHGKYKLIAITSRGEFVRKLFSQHLFDVRRAVPRLSPDGRYVSLTAKPGSVREVVIVATDGSGITWLTSYGPNSHASWRPVP